MTRNRVSLVLLIAAVTTVVLWRATPPETAPSSDNLARLGAQLYQDKGCVACHSVDGSARIGPSFKGDSGATVILADGSRTLVDADYIRESIVNPRARARPGYPDVMPSFEQQLDAREQEALVAYLLSVQ